MTWIALATVSALLSAAAAVGQKRVLRQLTPLEFSFVVSLAVLVLSLPVPFTTNVVLPARALGVLLAKSILGGVAFLLVMRGLSRNDLSSALPLLGLTPAAVALLAQGILDEPLRGGEWIGLALMLGGTALLEAREGRGLLAAWREALARGRLRDLLGAVALFAISTVADRWLVTGARVPPMVVLFYQHVAYAALFGAMLVRRPAVAGDAWPRIRETLPLVVAVAVATIGYRYFQLEATKVGPVALVLAVKRTSIVYASIVGGRLFAESRLVPRVAGGALIVAAGFLFLGRE